MNIEKIAPMRVFCLHGMEYLKIPDVWDEDGEMCNAISLEPESYGKLRYLSPLICNDCMSYSFVEFHMKQDIWHQTVMGEPKTDWDKKYMEILQKLGY